MRKIPGLDCILIIDDDSISNMMNQRLIESNLDVNIITCIHGLEAITYLNNYTLKDHLIPDILFLDINMPVMNGWEFLDSYRSLPNEAKAKILLIMLSEISDRNDQKKASENIDIDGTTPKKLTLERLEFIISHYLNE